MLLGIVIYIRKNIFIVKTPLQCKHDTGRFPGLESALMTGFAIFYVICSRIVYSRAYLPSDLFEQQLKLAG